MNEGNFEQACRSQTEGNARHHVDIGIQHRCHDKRRPAQRTDFGKPVISWPRPAEQHPELALHRAGKFEEIGIGIGHDIGRDCGWQQQHPFKQDPAGKFIAGNDPGRRHTEQAGKNANAHHQN